MNEIVEEFMRAFDVPGLSVATGRDGEMHFAEGFGVADRAAHQPVTVRSRFRIASISKPITATAVFRLIEQGMLSLSDTAFGEGGILGTTFGERPYSDALKEVTVEHLLAHTCGGWSNDASDPMFQNPEMDHRQLISWTLDNCPLTSAPGKNYAYSNFGYCVLGRIIEKVAAGGYAEVTRKSVLDPCGIVDMTVAGNTLADRQQDEVVYYGQGEDDPYSPPVSRMDSHGGWIATAADLLRFAFRVDGIPGEPDILQPDTIRSMRTASAANPGYAMGWAVNADGDWWHGGSLPGTATALTGTAAGLCWAALANTRVAGLGAELDKLMRRLAAGDR